MEANGSPIDHSRIEFKDPGGLPIASTYTVKFSMLSQFVLDEEGVDPRQLPEIMRSSRPGKVSLIFKLFAAGVAHHFVADRQPIPTAAEWAVRAEASGVTFAQIVDAVNGAIKKAPSPAEAATPAQPDAAAVN